MEAEPEATGAEGRRAPGALEAEVLIILHTSPQPLRPSEVSERLATRLAYSTVVTVLSRMHGKGLLNRTRHGRAYLYTPVCDPPGITALRMCRTLDGNPDREAVLTRFVDSLSRDDEHLLRQLLEPDPADRH